MTTVLNSFLKASSVPHTCHYADDIYYSHPNRNNMLGMKQMLENYGIKTVGVKFVNKIQAEMVFPCILHIPGSFVVGEDVRDDKITYVYEGKKRTKTVDEFCKIWTGHALMPDSDLQKATEPDYSTHRKQEIQHVVCKVLGAALAVLVWMSASANNYPIVSLFWVNGCMLDMLGLLVCYFLLEKQLFKKSVYGDKMCSAFHMNNCNEILFSSKSKIGITSWSEIGFGYFAGRLFCRSFFSNMTFSLAVIGWVAMLFGVWSVWQQARVFHKFCFLCTTVQAVIWANGILDILSCSCSGLFAADQFLKVGTLGCIVALSMLATHTASFYISRMLHEKEIIWELKSLKYDPDVFLAKLHKQEFYETSNNSKILLGNKNSETRITILSNPHCNPCAQMHKRVDALLKTFGDKFCVQYIFSSFNSELDDSSRFLISSYFQLEPSARQIVFQQWFDGEKYNAKDYIPTIPVTLRTQETENEMARHKAWCDRTGLSATPTILINGYILPDEYEIEDIYIISL